MRATTTTTRGTRGARKRSLERQQTYVERLQAVSGSVKTVDDILEEIFPYQSNYRRAELLITPPVKSRTDSPFESNRVVRVTPSPLASRGTIARKKRLSLPSHLQAIERGSTGSPVASDRLNSPIRVATTPTAPVQEATAVREHDQHTLALWEDKFRGRRLSPQDILFLVTHEDVARVLESAGLLREAGVNYDQLMELEVTLEASRKAQESATSNPGFSMYKQLCDSVWGHGVAFTVKGSSTRMPTVSAISTLSPRKGLLAPLSPAIERVSSASPVLPIPSPSPTRSPTKIKAKQRLAATALPYDRKFILTKQSSNEQDRQDGTRLRLQEEAQRRSILSEQQHRQIGYFDEIEFADEDTKVRYVAPANAVASLPGTRPQVLQTRWQNWRTLVTEQREIERFAALVTIQSCARVVIAKRVRAGYRVHYAATRLQALWRGFNCRKMLRRIHRYHQYTQASQAVQRCFRCHLFRRAFRKFLIVNRAASMITRAVRRYCVKRRLLCAWLHRLARFHAAIAIQLWFRVRVARIRRARARKKIMGSAALIMQHFFKRARLLVLFDKRVHLLLQKKTSAAQKLQAAYRAKLARAKFHALKDHLEAQKREEILRVMWENAYATSIQHCWRKKKHQQDIHRRIDTTPAVSRTTQKEDVQQEEEEEEGDCEYAIDMSSSD